MRRLFRVGFAGVIFAGLAPLLRAQDVAVLFDISGSMSSKHQSPYTEAFRARVSDLLLGRGIDAQAWSSTAPESVPKELQALLNGEPLVNRNSRVLVVRFGSLRRVKYPALPYFDSSLLTNDSASSFRDGLIAAFPNKAPEDRTNKDLAQAAAARYWCDHSSRAWYLVTISDFNEDAEVLNSSEQLLVDQFTAGRLVQRTAPIVLRWRTAPVIQARIEFDQRASTAALPSPEPRVLSITKPRNGDNISNAVRPTFAWAWNVPGDRPEERVEHFSIIVTARGSSKPVLQPVPVVKSGPYIASKPLPAGDYTWQVIATFASGEDGSRLPTVISAPTAFHVQSGGKGWILIPIGIAALVAASIGISRWRERRRKAV